ncbi:MAG: site-specific DNA-methyltransferase, partial [Epsilonproteobacteria bacterium]|nr:site-specific DNA-methyltransferase [Campylobacterota bacterium]
MIQSPNQERFFSLIKEIFIGEKIQGDGAYVNLMKLKSSYFQQIHNHLAHKLSHKNNKEEIYDKLYTFFHTYFDKSGGIMFANTPRWRNIYSKLSGKDVELFYKTKDLYYLKTQKVYNSMHLKLDGYVFDFRVDNLGDRVGNEKKELKFCFVDFET